MVRKNKKAIICSIQCGCLGLAVLSLMYMLNDIKPRSAKYCFVSNVLFYTPNAFADFIQTFLHFTRNFFEERELEIVKRYLPESAVILDIGANIGNHSLYWATQCNSAKIYAFEPIPDTFNILKRNVELNFQSERIKLFNIGLSDAKSRAEIDRFISYNTGETSIKKSHNGPLLVDKLDNIDIEENRIDLIKIDVEGHEIFILRGAIETIKKYKPVIFIEIAASNLIECNRLLESLEYKLDRQLSGENYLYIYKESEK